MNKKENWAQNITQTDDGIFRTRQGDASESLAIGRIIKAGFPCSKSEVNTRYDAILEVPKSKTLLRVQIKGFQDGSPRISFKGGHRSGGQIDKSIEKRDYVYNRNDCDIILAINHENGTCYLIPIEAIEESGKQSFSLKVLEEKYKENWDILFTIKPFSGN